MMIRYDTLVIGAGTAGLTTACQLAQAGQKVVVVATGIGALLLASGCIDVLGFHPADSNEPVKNPANALDGFLGARPDHPYNIFGRDNIEAGLSSFLQIVNKYGRSYKGQFNRNWLLPSGAGAVHPTCLAPESLTKGDLSSGKSMLIVGFKELRDFYPSLISQNLNEQDLGVTTGAISLDMYVPASSKMNATPIELANAFEQADFRKQVVKALKAEAKKFDRVGFPAALGLEHHGAVVADLEKQLGRPVFEISALPPSVPGRRLYESLKKALLSTGGRIIIGSKVIDGKVENGKVTQVRIETANRLRALRAHNYVLATGGIFGGGLDANADGSVEEVVFGLPVSAETNRHKWFQRQFISPEGQPVFNAGVTVNSRLQPVNGSSQPLANNLFAVGAILAGSEWTRGRTGDGIAVASAAAVANTVLTG
jgi:glycerol-3-phosphate dehydrogenase subunit B